MSEIIMLTNTRLSFPQLVEARAYQEGQSKKFSADLILDPAGEDWKKVMHSVMQSAQEKWGDNAQAVLQMCQADRKLRAFGNGAEKVDKKTFKPYEGYEGAVYVSANNANPPSMAFEQTRTMAASSRTARKPAFPASGECSLSLALAVVR